MYYLDSHIHLQDYKTQEVKNVVNNAIKNNVSAFINVSSYPQDWNCVHALAQQFLQIIPAYGVHPWYINEVSADWQDKLECLINENPQAIVGECGIDSLKNKDIQAQLKTFVPQINLANKYNRALIIHGVKANNELYKLFSKLPSRTIFHSFCGSAEWGREIQKHGFFIGLNFSILCKKNAPEIIQGISLDRVLLETDGPYQNNVKGKETLPQNLPFLAEKIAEMANVSIDNFLEQLKYNQQEFLGE